MTRRTIPGQNPGKPTAEAIADALIQHETGGCCRFGETCGLCDCAREGATPEQLETRDAMELDRARAVLALIPPQRCAPSEDEVAQTVLAHTPTSWRSFANDSLLLRCCGRDYGTPVRNLKRGEDGGAHAGYAAHLAEVITKLYGDQPTVAQAKAEALREMGKWFRLASQLGTGERDEIAAQACFDRAAAIESGGDR